MRLAGFQFSPGRASTLAVLMLLPILVGMGLWQLQRGQQKADSLAMRTANEMLPSRALEVIKGTDDEFNLKVQLRGRFDESQQFLLDNRVNQQRVGYEVLTPLVLENELQQVVLVNRGWIAAVSREQKPQLEIEGSFHVAEGYLMMSEPGFSLGEMLEPNSDWPHVIQYVDHEQMQKLMKNNLLPAMVLRMLADHPAALEPPQVGEHFGPERHYGYAFQWFALALTLLVLYFSINVQKLPNE